MRRPSGVLATSTDPARGLTRRHVVGPLVLVGAGLLLLLNNVGVVPWSIWGTLWPFWPIVVVLFGVEALLTGRVAWAALLLTLLLIGAGSVLVGALTTLGAPLDREVRSDPPTSRFRRGLDGATQAIVRVQYGAGTIQIGPSDDPTALAEGERYGSERAPSPGYQVRNGIGELTIRAGGSPRWAGFAGAGAESDRLDVRLSRSVPLELRVEAGAAQTALDLRELRVSDLRLELGASRGTLIMPAQGQTRARIQGGATALTIVVPPNVAARISVEQGLSDVRIDERRFPRAGDEYRSVEYETAANRVEIIMSMGAARVDVQ